MVALDVSAAVFGALDAILPNENRLLIERVQVSQGWGDTLFVTVFSAISHADAGAALTEAVHTIVDGVIEDRRHVVRIVWAEPT